MQAMLNPVVCAPFSSLMAGCAQGSRCRMRFVTLRLCPGSRELSSNSMTRRGITRYASPTLIALASVGERSSSVCKNTASAFVW
jgi:hypothetical protein